MSRLLLALGLVVVGVGLAPAPATAASGSYCTTTGVSVVVDFGALDGGVVQKGCAASGDGKTAWQDFTAAGFSLTPVQRFPGAVCRVDGDPASAGCVAMPPADAYWALFSSHGSGWSYASTGPASLTLHNGDTVAFSWQASSTERPPGADPAGPLKSAPTAHPTHRSEPTGHPTSASATPTTASAAPTSAARPTAGARVARRHRTTTSRPTPSPTSSPTAGALATKPTTGTPSTTASHSSDLAWWIPVGLLAVLGLGGVTAARLRRQGR